VGKLKHPFRGRSTVADLEGLALPPNARANVRAVLIISISKELSEQ